MNGLNRVQIIGNTGKAPEMRYTAAGKAVTTFSVAVNHTHRDAAGQPVEETEWFNCLCWDKLAETANSYVQKGGLLYVEGRLKTRTWEQDGSKHYKTELIVSDFKLLDRRPPTGDAAPAAADADDDGDNLPF